MPNIIYVPSRIGEGYFTDFQSPTSGATDNGKVWAWNSTTSKFEPTTIGGSTPGGSTTQVQYNASGSFAGDAGMTYDAVNDALTVSGRVITPVIRPASDSTTAVKIQNAAGTSDVMVVDTTNGTIYFPRGAGTNNTFIAGAGNGALTGQYNVGIGVSTLTSLTNAQQNLGIGAFSLTSLQSGNRNVAVGINCGNQITTGQDNVTIGNSSLYRNQTGSQNTVIGTGAVSGTINQSHSNNVGIGYHAGYVITTGSANTLIGTDVGDSLTSGSNNVFLGYRAGRSETTNSNRLHIANTNTKSLLLGDFNLNALAIGFADLSTPTAAVDVAPSTTARSSLRIRSGTAPTTPNAGDLWFDGTNLKFYDGSATRTITWS